MVTDVCEMAKIAVMIMRAYEKKEANGDFSLLNNEELQQIIEQSKHIIENDKPVQFDYIDFNQESWIEWLHNENNDIYNRRAIEAWFAESYKEELKKIPDFRSLQHYASYNNGYISQSDYNYYLSQTEFKLVGYFNKPDKKKRYWNWVYHSSIMQEVLSQLNVISDEEYNKYIESITPPAQEKKLTAPDLGNGAITCVILCCITLIFNFFWVYWIIIWVGYYFWYKEQIRKYNPQHFREEEENGSKKL
jgi:hypothetical protein